MPVSFTNEESAPTCKQYMKVSEFLEQLRHLHGGSLSAPSSSSSSSPSTAAPDAATGATAGTGVDTAAFGAVRPINAKQLDLDDPDMQALGGPSATPFNALFAGCCHGWTSWLRRPFVTSRFLWLGSANSVTGLHHDDEHSVMVVVRGSKQVTLFPPHQAPLLSRNSKFDSGTICFDYNPLLKDFRAYPGAAAATPVTVVLRQGDVLLIPKYWLHFVLSLTPSVTMNAFASNLVDDVSVGFVRRVLEALHNRGLYRTRSNCVCHNAADDFTVWSRRCIIAVAAGAGVAVAVAGWAALRASGKRLLIR